jgi:hypothetical protein
MVFDGGADKRDDWSELKMITAYKRGHKVYRDGADWRYVDDNTLIANERPCARCGKTPTPEGYDACLGYIKGAISACCGHGMESPILIKGATT